MEILKYRNPWYTGNNTYSKEWYTITCACKAEEHKGFYIIRNVNPWVDVVEHVEYGRGNEEFVCVTQRGSVKNAKEYIDSLEQI